MAFSIPPHLPRQKDLGMSTVLLTKMSEATTKSLTYDVASSWATELDEAIRQTTKRIHDRVQADLPKFEQQLSTSRSVQERLLSLSSSVDILSTTLSHPETGMIPNLIKTLTQHAALAQEVLDTDNAHRALAYLARCRQVLVNVTALVDQGRLSEAWDACGELEAVLETMPAPLETAGISNDLKRRYRSVKDRTQEQLTEAYSRAVSLSPHQIVIKSSIQVRQSESVLPLSSVISSLSSLSLAEHLNSLRRDLTTHYIDHVLSQPLSADVSNEGSEFRLTLFPTPPNTENLIARVDTLSAVLTFLIDHLFPSLPSDRLFSRTLCKSVTTGLLNKLLIPSLPSSMDRLPQYLSLLRRAVRFEEEFIAKLRGGESRELDVKLWADGIAAHYERKRRMELLDRARTLILRDEDDSEQFRVEVVVGPDTPKEPEIGSESVYSGTVTIPSVEDGAWGFEEANDSSNAIDEDGWGFDDESPSTVPEPLAPSGETAEPGDAWGWNDDEPSPEDDPDTEDSSAWDDPWGDGNVEPAPTPAPKAATRLERHAAKVNGSIASPPLLSPNPVAAPPPTPAISVGPRLSAPPAPVLQEFYVVSGRVKELMFLIEDVLREAEELSASGLLPSTSGKSSIGSIIGQAAAMVLDLYRALYPVSCADQLAKLPKRSMRFSNDCLWVSDEIGRVLANLQSVISPSSKEKLMEGRESFQVLGESWFEDCIDNQCQNVNDILDSASGFSVTADQDRFDECEAAVNDVLQNIRKWSQQVKPVLTKSKYYNAIGAVVEAALSRMLRDVLALQDIPEIESHKLSELCRILGALESLFVEDVEQSSFVVAYVPSWLKFSYLSELLEASIADISYLFEEGALVDFEIEELVKLVRALFADTPLRTNTVNKLMQGHPVQP